MATETDLIGVVLEEMTDVLARVSRVDPAALAVRLDAAERVFVVGEGRSGFMAQGLRDAADAPGSASARCGGDHHPFGRRR